MHRRYTTKRVGGSNEKVSRNFGSSDPAFSCGKIEAQLAGGGPIYPQVMNYDFYVGVGNYSTLHLALLDACVLGYGKVIIEDGATPSDATNQAAIETVTGGCAGVYVWDERSSGLVTYTFSGSTYAPTMGLGGPVSISGTGSTSLLTITNTQAGGAYLLKMFQPNLSTNNGVYLDFGQAASQYNSAIYGFKFAGGAGSASNFASIGVYGAPGGWSIDGSGNE